MTEETQNDTQDTTIMAEGETEKPSQLQLLKRRADLMGVTYSNNIGVDALRKKIEDHLNKDQQENIELANAAIDAQPAALGGSRNRDLDKLSAAERMRLEQMALVRCRIYNLDPKKANLPGEIFTIANRVLGTVRKFIPYGEQTDDGYHIPRILYNELKERKFLHIRSFKDKVTKQIRVETKWLREFNIEELPMLTEKELHDLATAQIAAGSVQPVGDLG